MASGIVIINKPSDWTSMDVCAPWDVPSHGDPDFGFSGGSEFRLQQDFANGKMLGRRKSAEAWRRGGAA